jgi:NAD(P)-dependent dehydrogenase (short-subunit alcohol dehydrogenase family)
MTVLLVTGAARGIGADIALLGAERGWDVAVNYVGNTQAAEEVCGRIEATGNRALPVQADVSDENAVEAMFRQIKAELGPISGLVNNAGVNETGGPIEEIDIDLARRAMDVNYFGTFLCCRSGVSQMSKSNGGPGGAIVNISSAAARLGGGGAGLHYAGSKAAVDILTIGLAKQQAAAGVRVNCVRPGITRTDMVAIAAEKHPEWYEQASASVPLGYVAEVRDISTSVVWLLSEEASYITGAIVDVSGGMATP